MPCHARFARPTASPVCASASYPVTNAEPIPAIVLPCWSPAPVNPLHAAGHRQRSTSAPHPARAPQDASRPPPLSRARHCLVQNSKQQHDVQDQSVVLAPVVNTPLMDQARAARDESHGGSAKSLLDLAAKR